MLQFLSSCGMIFDKKTYCQKTFKTDFLKCQFLKVFGNQMFRIRILAVTYILFSRAITSTPSHLQVDHFLDSVLENSNSNDLLQTPRRHSPPPSPPGGMSEHSWLPELSLSSFLGSLPTENGATESPSKMLSHAEDSIQSTGSEVDRQLTMMLNENSLDFTSKFAHLASALNSTD